MQRTPNDANIGRQAFNETPNGANKGQQAFNENPEGVASSQPRASERSERHPGLDAKGYDSPPEGAKARTEAFKFADSILSVAAFAPSGGESLAYRATQGAVRFAHLPWAGSSLPLWGAGGRSRRK